MEVFPAKTFFTNEKSYSSVSPIASLRFSHRPRAEWRIASNTQKVLASRNPSGARHGPPPAVRAGSAPLVEQS